MESILTIDQQSTTKSNTNNNSLITPIQIKQLISYLESLLSFVEEE